MHYIRPSEALDHFSRYVREDVTPDSENQRGEFVSMALALDTISRELSGIFEAVRTQRAELLDALDEVEDRLDAVDDDGTVAEAIEEARERIEAHEPATNVYDIDDDLREASQRVLSAIDDEMGWEEGKELREPLYAFLTVQVETELEAIDDGRGIAAITREEFDDE